MEQNPHKTRRASGQMHQEGVEAGPWSGTNPTTPAMKQHKDYRCDIVDGESDYRGERRNMDTDRGSN